MSKGKWKKGDKKPKKAKKAVLGFKIAEIPQKEPTKPQETALELPKPVENEPQNPPISEEVKDFKCGTCLNSVQKGSKFCETCGTGLNWAGL